MTAKDLAAAFEREYGRPPDGIWAAPGRINLIGEHTDYAEGFVLPLALPHRTLTACSLRQDGLLRCASARADERGEAWVADLSPGSTQGWAAYVAGVAWALRDAGHEVGGADVYVDGDLPLGAGLSSSAALECSVASAYNALHGLGLDVPALAALCQRAENAFVGMPSGIMDQMAALACTAGHALFLDCRTLATEQVPFDLASRRHELLVIDTRAPHRLVDGEYASRRTAAEEAARALGVRTLRDVAEPGLPAALDTLDGWLRPYARHVVTENARVLAAVDRMRGGDLAGLGRLMTASHVSLRDDYRVSSPELDVAVDAALDTGALGARMTGGGFGGCAIALLDGDASTAARQAIRQAYAARGFAEPRFFPAVPSAGAERVR